MIAAFFAWLAAPVAADTVSVTSADAGLSVTGDVLGYDGRYLRLQTAFGEVTVDYLGATCSGAACPDPAASKPSLRVSGPPDLTQLLLPALIEAYGRTTTARVTRSADAGVLTYEIDWSGRFVGVSLSARSNAEAFADLVANEADVVVATRALTPDELALARDAGLGRVTDRQQIFAISADVIVSDEDRTRIDPTFLLEGAQRGITASEAPVPLATSPAGPVTIVPFGQEGLARPLALSGPCGRSQTATRRTLKTGDYVLSRPLFLYRPARRIAPEADDFLIWLRSREAQRVVRRAGFIDLGAEEIPLAEQGARLRNAIESAGPEIGLGELQRLVRILSGHVRLTPTFRFEEGSTRLTPQSQSYLLQVARSIREGQYRGRELMLAGFSDGRGPALANRDLSAARAQAVRRALLDILGSEPTDVSLTTEAFGEALPIGCDEVEWGRQLNRRVELWLSTASE